MSHFVSQLRFGQSKKTQTIYCILVKMLRCSRCSRVCAEIKADRNQGIDDCSFVESVYLPHIICIQAATLGAHSTHEQSAVGNSAYCCYSNSGEKLLFLFINDDLILNTSCRLKCSLFIRVSVYLSTEHVARSRNRYNFFHPKHNNIFFIFVSYFPIIFVSSC